MCRHPTFKQQQDLRVLTQNLSLRKRGGSEELSSGGRRSRVGCSAVGRLLCAQEQDWKRRTVPAWVLNSEWVGLGSEWVGVRSPRGCRGHRLHSRVLVGRSRCDRAGVPGPQPPGRACSSAPPLFTGLPPDLPEPQPERRQTAARPQHRHLQPDAVLDVRGHQHHQRPQAERGRHGRGAPRGPRQA